MENYYSLPVLTQAVQFVYGNWEEIVTAIGLNKVQAKGVYLTADNNIAPPNTLTEKRAIIIATRNPGERLVAVIGDYIVKSEDEHGVEFFPVPAADFERMYVKDTRMIGNGQHTFGQLYDQLEQKNKSISLASEMLNECQELLSRVAPFIDQPSVKVEMENLSERIKQVLNKQEPASPLKIVE